MLDLVSFFETLLNTFFLIKVLFLLAIIIYIIFLLVVVKQVSSMNAVIREASSTVLRNFSILMTILAILLFLTALVIL